VLAALGGVAARLYPVTITAPHIMALQPAAEPFLVPTQVMAVSAHHAVAPWFVVAWLLGLTAILTVRLVRWSRLRDVVRGAQDIALASPVRVKSSSSLLEPGLVGVLHPAVLLPAGLMARLSAAEMNAILAHEFTHFRNRDNLTAAIHMVVEALFWFYPPVWLIGARLIAERERACDENVLARGHDPEVYAGGILKVCKFCLQSPLSSAAGVSGGNLGQRVREIMTAPRAIRLNPAKRFLLTIAAFFTVALPVTGGFLSSPMAAPMAAEVRRTVVAVQAHASGALERSVNVVAEQIGAAPVTAEKETRLPRLKLASVPPVQAIAPSFTVAPTAPPPTAVIDIAPAQIAQAAPPAPNTDALTPVQQAVRALDPRGEGDPRQITCRVPQPMPGSRLRGPEVCKANREWAQIAANRQVLNPDGQTLTSTALNSRNCADPRLGNVQPGSMKAVPGTVSLTLCN
jgi:beta-lactamase regulating signal transducer with metallopeptidase domain